MTDDGLLVRVQPIATLDLTRLPRELRIARRAKDLGRDAPFALEHARRFDDLDEDRPRAEETNESRAFVRRIDSEAVKALDDVGLYARRH